MDGYNIQLEQEHLSDVLADLESVFSSPNPLYTLLHQKVLAAPARCAVTDGAISFSYAQLFHQVLGCAQQLSERGVTSGARIALYLPNIPNFYVWYHALHAVGAIIHLVPVSLHEREIARIFEHAQPFLVVTDSLLRMQQIYVCNENLRAIPVLDVSHMLAPSSDVLVAVQHGRRDDDVAVILYTSGSTGDPRGVALSVKNILTNAAQSLVRMCTLGLDDDGERFLAILPLSHAFGHMTCLWLPLIAGATVYIMPVVKRKDLAHAFAVFKPTAFFMVPALAGLMCTMHTLQMDSVKAFVSGGDFLSSKIAAAFELLFGRRICSGYGLSEASPVVGIQVNPRADTSVFISPLLPGISYKIIPVHAESVGSGELMLQGDGIFQGYFERYDQPLKKVLVDGWLPTGDLVRQAASGDLAMIGRSKDVIVFKGFNIYPQEVERVLLMHPSVYMAVVVGIEHESFGEIPVAVVALRQGMLVTEKELVGMCKQHLASYKIPHRIIVRSEMPLNHVGKIDRRTVKKMIDG